MKASDERIGRHVIKAAVIAVALYALSFWWIEHRRTFKGPWEVTFQSDGAGRPTVVIRQGKLGIVETLAFPEENVAPNLRVMERFSDATNQIPFGKVLFQDPTFLPGTLTMELFGHEIEAVPRVLVIDKKEIAWSPNGRVEVEKRK
jgi:hypothetical protein